MSIMRSSGDQAGGRRWLTLAAAAAMTVALAACGSAAGSGKAASSSAKAGGTNLTMWLVTTGPSPANTVINQSVSAFEKNHPDDTITVNYIENQSYKQKIQLAMGAGTRRPSSGPGAAARSSSSSTPATWPRSATPATPRTSCPPRSVR